MNFASATRHPSGDRATSVSRRRRASWGLTLLVAAACLPAPRREASADDVFVEGAKPRLVLKGAGEGPAWDPKLGLLFSGRGGIGRWDRDGRQSVYREKAGTNGLLFDRSGRLLSCEPVRRLVSRTQKDGSLRVLTERYRGKRYNQPNDITVDSKGRIYFSDPRYGNRDGMEIEDAQGKKVEGVYRVDLDGTVTRVITHEVDRPNGLVVTADDKHLFVADNNNNEVGGARKLWRFRLRGDGSLDLGSRKLIYDWGDSRGPDGMVLDVKGRLYVAGGLNKANAVETNTEKAGVYVFSPAGKLVAFAPVPSDEVTNCTFGGEDLKTLFITAGGELWRVATTTAGKMPWPR